MLLRNPLQALIMTVTAKKTWGMLKNNHRAV